MATSDATQNQFNVGDVVNVPCIVTAIGGTPQEPTVTMTTKYDGYDGNADTVGPLDNLQVVLNKQTGQGMRI